MLGLNAGAHSNAFKLPAKDAARAEDRMPHAVEVGIKAQRLLQTPEFAGRVLAVVSNAAYLHGDGDGLLWIAQRGVPAHSRGILLSATLHSIVRNMPFSVSGKRLDIGGVIEVNLASATIWSAPRVLPSDIASLDELGRRSANLPASFGEDGKELIAAIKLLINNGSDDDPMYKLFAQVALPVVEQVAKNCLDGDFQGAMQVGEELLGMGPGLTPAGDDFLGGILFAAKVLRDAYPDIYPCGIGPVAVLRSKAKVQTNLISATLLGDLSEGDGPAPLHELLCCLLREGPSRQLGQEVRRLSDIGHSTGRCLLAGVLTGLLPAVAEAQINKTN